MVNHLRKIVCLLIILLLPVMIFAQGAGYSLYLDGVGDYLSIANSDDWKFGSGEFTIDLWVYFESKTGGSYSKCLMSTYEGGAYGWELNWLLTANLKFDFKDIGGNMRNITRSWDPNLNSWYHIAVVRSGNDFSLYVNGDRLENVESLPYSMNTFTRPLNVGWYYNYPGDRDFKGYFEEIRIWIATALDTTTIRNWMHKKADSNHSEWSYLVGYWRFDDQADPTDDYSDNSNTGDVENATFQTSTVPIAGTNVKDKTDIRAVWSSNTSNSSSIMNIEDSNISDTDCIIFGHDNGALTANTSDVPSTINRRLNRVWRLEEYGTLTGDVMFDCTNLGIGDGSDLRLLVDVDGTFSDATIVTGSYSSPNFTVFSHDFLDGYYYTLASTSSDNSLPVGLSYFCAVAGNERITLKWTTESEIDNLGFNIYRSPNSNSPAGGQFLMINDELISNAGNSSQRHDYEYVDNGLTNGVTYWYKLEDVDYSGNTKLHGPVSATPMKRSAPKEFRLYPNYPNPFNPVTTISYDLPDEGLVELTVYNMRGEKVTTLMQGKQAAGSYKLNWDGTDRN
ncbi:MAG: hypothetical protein ISS29_05125, partial [Candidatus Marinimicrobia bacterium]|nr:hypothetical protein [Candidatus Neomarinimicrobiota bacterium]